MRLSLPDGYRIAPHFHSADEHVTVLSGSFQVGMGETFEAGPWKLTFVNPADQPKTTSSR